MTVRATTSIAGRSFVADLSTGRSLAIPLRFDGPQPNAFFLERATAEPVRAGSYVGSTRLGGSTNCHTLRLTPHGNGTHTECVGHIVNDAVSIDDTLGGGLFRAAVVTAPAVPLEATDDASEPCGRGSDLVVCDANLRAALASVAGADDTDALVVRVGGVGAELRHATWSGNSPPYFTLAAMRTIAAGPWTHLLTELPSLDRDDDDGALANHRQWWGLRPRVHELDGAEPSPRTVTEMIVVPDDLPDGLYLLGIEVAPFVLDAAPSRPILYALEPAQ